MNSTTSSQPAFLASTTSNVTALDLLVATGDIIANESNSTWLSAAEVEHFLGDPDVLHAVALILGIGAIVWGRRLPHMLAAVASTSLGLWVGLVVQDRQHFDTPLWGSIDLPEGKWFPWAAGISAAAAAAVLSYFTWKLALALLTGGLVTLIALAACRVANVSPEKLFELGSSLLSSYRIVGAVVLTLSVIAFFLLVRKCHKQMAEFASATLGTLLLLSGVSHFSSRVGAEAPFSLLDDMARMAAEVRNGNCHLWDAGKDGKEDTGLLGCDCGEKCRTEIAAWLASSAIVLVSKCALRWYRSRAESRSSQEETAPLRDAQDTPSVSPQVVGAKSV